jgi:hypothetical protein
MLIQGGEATQQPLTSQHWSKRSREHTNRACFSCRTMHPFTQLELSRIGYETMVSESSSGTRCSPDLNPIEHLWALLKRALYRLFPAIDQLRGPEDYVERELGRALQLAWVCILDPDWCLYLWMDCCNLQVVLEPMERANGTNGVVLTS